MTRKCSRYSLGDPNDALADRARVPCRMSRRNVEVYFQRTSVAVATAAIEFKRDAKASECFG
jgi:hypothetical protein